MSDDIVAVIGTIKFGDESEVYADTYLDELEECGQWCTPRKYHGLDGNGRKLILYDGRRKALTAEVEIENFKKTDEEPDFPWCNKFRPGTVWVFPTPITLKHIHTVPGLEKLGIHRKSHRNINGEQYLKANGGHTNGM